MTWVIILLPVLLMSVKYSSLHKSWQQGEVLPQLLWVNGIFISIPLYKSAEGTHTHTHTHTYYPQTPDLGVRVKLLSNCWNITVCLPFLLRRENKTVYDLNTSISCNAYSVVKQIWLFFLGFVFAFCLLIGFALPMACGSPQAKDRRTHTTAMTWATAGTTPDL